MYSIPPSLRHIDGLKLLRFEESISIALMKANKFIDDSEKGGCKHLIDDGLLEQIKLSNMSLRNVEKELQRRSISN